MADDFEPPSPEDLDASGRDLILEYADDRLYLSEVLSELGLPDLAAVRARMSARRLISEPLQQMRPRGEVLAQRAAERRRVIEEGMAIDTRYRDVPVAWPGPLETNADIAAASVAMQREAEGENGQRTVLVREDHESWLALAAAMEAALDERRPFVVVWRSANVTQYYDRPETGGWTLRQVPPDDRLGVDTSDEDAAIREIVERATSGRERPAVEIELVAAELWRRRSFFSRADVDEAHRRADDAWERMSRERTPEEDAELERRALDVLQRVPWVQPDPGDEMPPERSLVLRRRDTMSGAPIFRGTRVTVSTLFDHLADGYSLAEIVDSFPTLDRDDCVRAIRLAGRLLADRAPDETPD